MRFRENGCDQVFVYFVPEEIERVEGTALVPRCQDI